MHKNIFSFLTHVVFWLFFFQSICLVVFSQKEKTWSKPFRECWNYKSKQIDGEKIASDKYNNIIIFPNLSGLLTAINIKTGEVLWNMEIGGK